MKKTQKLYNWGEVPGLLLLSPGDRIRFNKHRNFYTVNEIYDSWVIAQRKTRRGYSFAIMSLTTFVETADLFGKIYHVARIQNIQFAGTVEDAYKKVISKLRERINILNRDRMFKVPYDCVFSLEIRGD